jgi:UDP-N-acetylmuramoyl-L-alanyl-D-glutamate--2,6-diaminopimelate ligase
MANLKQTIRKKLPIALSTYHFLWAWYASKLHRQPSRKIFVIGVTGTKGKTTTLELVNAILEAAGKKTAICSSLHIKLGDDSRKNWVGNTMPGRGFIQNFLARAVRAGCGYALIEVSSEGVVAHRHRFVDWNLGVLTNLAPEHIESHGSFEKYRAAKLEFLEYVLARGGKVFLNEDDSHFPFFSEALTNAQNVPYSVRGDELENYLPKESPVRAAAGAALPEHAGFLLSDFNRSNIACAVAVAKELGISETVIQKAIADFKGVPGRMDAVKVGGYTAVADYAHTPESLEAAYRAVKPQKENARLVCVLGACGGGRDTWKRPEFGKIAAKYCDVIILTEEDPYDESSEAIMEQIAGGFPAPALNAPAPVVLKIPDRREAIVKAVELAAPGDVIIGTGKGSEDWIHYAHGKKLPWNEREEFAKALAQKVANPPLAEGRDGKGSDGPDLELPWV